MTSVRLIFMLLISPVICGVALVKPFIGLCGLVFMYYFRPDVWNPPGWYRPQLWYTIAVGVGWIVHLKNVRFPPLIIVATLVVTLTYVTAPFAIADTVVAEKTSLIVLKLATIMLFTVNLVDTPKKLHWFLWANIAGMVYNLKAIFQHGFSGGLEDRVDVAVGQGGGANYLAMILTMSIPFLYMRVLNARGTERLIAIVLTPLYLFAVVLTGSRAGFISLAAVCLYLLFRSNKKLLGTGVIACLTILFVILLPESFVDRFNQGLGIEGKRDRSAESRIMLWRAAVTMFQEHPLKGVGIENFQSLSPRYSGFFASKGETPYEPGKVGRGYVAHSTWLQMLAEGGLLISVPFFLLFVMVFVITRRVKKAPFPDPLQRELAERAVTFEGMFIAFIISSTFGSHFKIDFMWWYLGAVAALAVISDRRVGEQLGRVRAERAAAFSSTRRPFAART
jgi:O-antigen ligase